MKAKIRGEAKRMLVGAWCTFTIVCQVLLSYKINKLCSLLSESSWSCKGEKEKISFNMKTAVQMISIKLYQKEERKKFIGRG